MSTDPTRVSFDLSKTVAPIASELRLAPNGVRGALDLLSDGCTIPFIARYRKENTGGLDEVQIGAVEDALTAATELIDRKNRVLKSIFRQGVRDSELEHAIVAAHDAREVDDLYLPYKGTRKTRATVARERGLDPLASILAAQVDLDTTPASILRTFVDPAREVENAEAALKGAGDIIAERWSEDPATRASLRDQLGRGFVKTKKKRGYDSDDHRFEAFYDYREPIARLAPHRFLAIRRGESEHALSLAIEVDDARLTGALARRLLTNPGFVFRRELEATVGDCYARLLKPSISTEVLSSLRAVAEKQAIGVFATNLGELVLAPPAH